MKILYLVKEKIDGDLAKSFNSFVINLWEIDNNAYDSVLDKIFECDKTICI